MTVNKLLSLNIKIGDAIVIKANDGEGFPRLIEGTVVKEPYKEGARHRLDICLAGTNGINSIERSFINNRILCLFKPI